MSSGKCVREVCVCVCVDGSWWKTEKKVLVPVTPDFLAVRFPTFCIGSANMLDGQPGGNHHARFDSAGIHAEMLSSFCFARCNLQIAITR